MTPRRFVLAALTIVVLAWALVPAARAALLVARPTVIPNLQERDEADRIAASIR